MIRLDVERYCNRCAYFDPETKTSMYRDFNGDMVGDHMLVCKRGEICNIIEKHIRNEIEKEQKKNAKKQN